MVMLHNYFIVSPFVLFLYLRKVESYPIMLNFQERGFIERHHTYNFAHIFSPEKKIKK